jgi:hypothetical protein
MGRLIDITDRLQHKIRNDVYQKLDLKDNTQHLPRRPENAVENENRIVRIKQAIDRINETMRILKQEVGIQNDLNNRT